MCFYGWGADHSYIGICLHSYCRDRCTHTVGWDAKTQLCFSQTFIHTAPTGSVFQDNYTQTTTWEVWTVDSDQPQTGEGTEFCDPMNYRDEPLLSPLAVLRMSECFPFSSQIVQIQSRFTVHLPNNWCCIREACLLSYISNPVTLWTMPFLLLLLPASQSAG